MTTHNIKVIAAQRNSISDFLFSLGDFKFHMPTDLEKQLNISSSDNKGSCYGTMMTVYQENPFFSEMVRKEANQNCEICLNFNLYFDQITCNLVFNFQDTADLQG